MRITYKNFLLTNNINNFKNIFSIITHNIPRTIFSKLNSKFFEKLIKEKIINIYIIKKDKRIVSLITTTSVKNYVILKRKIFLFFIQNPFIILNNLNFFFNILFRDFSEIDIKMDKNYLHLLHLVIFKKKFFSIPLSKKDYLINFFFKKILKINSANTFYLCYEKDNFNAQKFYKRNKFKIFKKNRNTIFVKKKFKI